jgi:hypothetical protein
MTQEALGLVPAHSLIFSRTNISRAFSDFDDTDIAGIYRRDDDIIVVRKDGSEQNYPAQPVRDAFISYTARLKNFFAYLGPKYKGPSIWHNNAYVLFKGWCYSSQLGSTTTNAKLQAQWQDKFTKIYDQASLIALLQGDQTDLGHLVSPDGLRLRPMESNLLSEDMDSVGEEPVVHRPYCSCGSFQYQSTHLQSIQEEIPDYQPTCIHITWFNRYRQFLTRRAQLRNECRGSVAQQATAWAYAPPAIGETKGRFTVLYTKSGSMAPLKQWRLYKPDEIFTQDDAWNLFDAMMDAGFVPFPAMALPQLSHAFKNVSNNV